MKMSHSDFLKLKEAWASETPQTVEEKHVYSYDSHPSKRFLSLGCGCYTTLSKARPDVLSDSL